MSLWKIIATVLAATVGVVLALLLAGWSQGLALLAYVQFVGAVALLVLAGRLREALPPSTGFDQLLAAEPKQVEPIGQLQTISRGLEAAEWSQAELHYRLAPMVREVAAGRLSRRHGVDLARQPERAKALLGGRVWELAGPRPERLDNRAGGWSRSELEELLDELERI